MMIMSKSELLVILTRVLADLSTGSAQEDLLPKILKTTRVTQGFKIMDLILIKLIILTKTLY